MVNQEYKKMLDGKSVIRELSEYAAKRGKEIGYENVFDFSLGNPSVPVPESFTRAMIDLLQKEDPMLLHGYTPSLGNQEYKEKITIDEYWEKIRYSCENQLIPEKHIAEYCATYESLYDGEKLFTI